MTAPEAKYAAIVAADLADARQAEADGLPFVLTCVNCEAGSDLHSIDEALAAGWTELYAEPSGVSWNFSGRCKNYDDELDYCRDEPGTQHELFT